MKNSDTYRIVRKMIESGNQPGVIELWKNMVAHWAQRNIGPDADAVKAFLPLWQTRPLYNDDELAPIFPVLGVALGLRDKPAPAKPAARLRHELIMAGLPHRVVLGKTYFAVECLHIWRDAPDMAWIERIEHAAHG